MTQTPRQGEAGVLVSHVPAWALLWSFAKISAQSWGGGTATIFIMNRELVRRGWINSAQFALDFGLSRLVPGINLLAVAVILGYRLNGLVGSLCALGGLMLPASLVTILLTIGFAELTGNPIGAAVIRGVVPVTAALTFALALEQALEIMPWREVRTAFLMIAYGATSFVLVAALHVSVALVIVAGIVIGALLFAPPEEGV